MGIRNTATFAKWVLERDAASSLLLLREDGLASISSGTPKLAIETFSSMGSFLS